MLKGIVSGVEKDIVRIPMKGKNLFDKSAQAGQIYVTDSAQRYGVEIPVPSGTYTVSGGTSTSFAKTKIGDVYGEAISLNTARVFTLASDGYMLVYAAKQADYDEAKDGIMLNTGNQALPYEPYGYQEGWEVRDNQDRLIWGREDELQTATGTLQLKGYGLPVKVKSLLGNGQQTGTPTPDNIIMPTFCGVRTGNLFDESTIEVGGLSQSTGEETTESSRRRSGFIPVLPSTQYTISRPRTGTSSYLWVLKYRDDKSYIGVVDSVGSTNTFVTGTNTYFLRWYTTQSYDYTSIMLNTGSTALPYEPYGWAEKITCAGQTVPVYLGQTQTVRRIKKLVMTGDETYTSDPSYSRFITVLPNAKIEGLRLTQVYCTHFISVHDGRPISEVPNNSIYSSDVAVDRFFIKTTDYTSAADFKSYLAAQYAAGTPVTVWYVLATPETGIVNEPLAKIGDYADELNDTVATLPEIPTTTGQNTLTVDTTLAPSSLTVKGHVKALT